MRFVRFNAVGLLGFAVQFAVLALLIRGGVHYLAATAIAVEAAIFHNFVWHERWTWPDRAGGRRSLRLLRFHMANGAVSLAGNLLLMGVLVGRLHLAPVSANLIAVAACATLNFIAADRVVFER
jgi:putative flippase GtrA